MVIEECFEFCNVPQSTADLEARAYIWRRNFLMTVREREPAVDMRTRPRPGQSYGNVTLLLCLVSICQPQLEGILESSRLA